MTFELGANLAKLVSLLQDMRLGHGLAHVRALRGRRHGARDFLLCNVLGVLGVTERGRDLRTTE